MDWSIGKSETGEQRNCADCKHSKPWRGYSELQCLVCYQEMCLKVHGGPRSCQDIVRAIHGACGPHGTKWQRKEQSNG